MTYQLIPGGSHMATRDMQRCSNCGQAWPCEQARAALEALFGRMRLTKAPDDPPAEKPKA